jgi:NCS1 family nucleobase:cation symporter-1
MDLSDFTPPARLSLTDQEISQRLGEATADEAGMIAAMDFLEQQTNLREQDNQATETWLEKMHSSEDPRAAVALQNFERAKQGLEPLPLIPPVPEYPTFNPSPSQPISVDPETVVQQQSAVVGSAEEAAEEFEELLTLSAPPLDPAIEEIVEVETVSNIPAPKVRGVRLVSAANWILGVGVLVPAFAAGLSAMLGLNFVTSILAGLVGVLVGVKVNVFALVTARRTKRGLAVSSRAAFGVFGAIIPGVLLLLAGVGAILAIAFASAKYFNNTVVGLGNFEDPLLSAGGLNLTLGSALALGAVALAALLGIFGGSFARWLKIVLGSVVLLGFVAYAVVTVPGIDYLNLAGVFQWEEFLKAAPLFALLVSVFAYGVDGESIAAASWGASKKALTWPILVFGFLLPLLTYGHIAALLNGHNYETGLSVIQTLMTSGASISATIFVDVAIVAVVALLFVAVAKLIEALKTLGTNHIGFGLATIVAISVILLAAVVAFFANDSLAFAVGISGVLLIPSAAWVGAMLTETLMRRGNYHDASLTRSYGFYGSVNWTALVGLVFATFVGFAIAQPVKYFNWLGFLRVGLGFQVDIVFAALIALGIGVVFTLVTAFPRIFRQQRETKSVEDRRFDLVDVVVD